MNIASYPEHIRKVLEKLEVGRFTRPVPVGNTFVIYMRFEDAADLACKNFEPVP